MVSSTGIFAIILGFIIILLVVYSQGYNVGYSNCESINRLNPLYNFECNEYSNPYFSCNKSLQFQNITGLYCDGKLVCQNNLKLSLT